MAESWPRTQHLTSSCWTCLTWFRTHTGWVLVFSFIDEDKKLRGMIWFTQGPMLSKRNWNLRESTSRKRCFRRNWWMEGHLVRSTDWVLGPWVAEDRIFWECGVPDVAQALVTTLQSISEQVSMHLGTYPCCLRQIFYPKVWQLPLSVPVTGSVIKRVISIVFPAYRGWDSVTCNEAQKGHNIPSFCLIVLSVHLSKFRPAPILHWSEHNVEVKIRLLQFSVSPWILPIELKGPHKSQHAGSFPHVVTNPELLFPNQTEKWSPPPIPKAFV